MHRLLATLIIAATPASAEELVDYVVENAAVIPSPLATVSADRISGEAALKKASCSSCHDPNAMAAIGEMAAGELRLWIVEPSLISPGIEMPGYYSPGVYGEAPDELVGRTRLSAEEIEQLIAYLTAE
ncbi:MAG: hypothetical protein AAF401_15995 [Pseudomonadota bacterium]